MTALDLLRQLQAADSAGELEHARLIQVRAILNDRGEFEAARTEHVERAEARRKLEAQQRDLELEVETHRQQLADIEKKLYGGTVRDSKELQNLTRESTQVKNMIGTREDRLLQVLDDAEQAAAAHVQAEKHLRAVVGERRKTEAALLAEHKEIERSIEAHRQEREQLRAQLEPAVVKHYDVLRKRLGGVAVAGVTQRTCQGCRVSINAHVEQRLRQGAEIVHCQSCGRALFLDD